MIQVETKLEVADNSGARQVQCIKVLGNAKEANIGDVIVVSIKNALPKEKSKVRKGDVCMALIVRTVKGLRRKDGSYIRFDDNAVVILSKQREMIGSRLFGPTAHELREKGFSKILSLAPEVL